MTDFFAEGSLTELTGAESQENPVINWGGGE